MSPRAGYLVLTWPGAAEAATGRAQDIGRMLDATPQWRAAHTADGLRVWTTTRDPLPVQVRAGGRDLIIGAVFDMPGVPASDPPGGDPRKTAQWLSRSSWGRYVGLLRNPAGAETWIYRDPSGGLNAFAWPLGDGLEVVASQMSALPAAISPRRPSLNWRRIADLVAKPAVCATQVLVDDVVAIQPGECLKLSARASELVWSPSAFAAAPFEDREAAAAELRACVDSCTAALVGGYDRTILEVSGGLDSAIIAGTLQKVGLASRVAEGINHAFGRPESDEEPYAHAVARRAGIRLTQRRHAPDALDLADLDELAGEFRPSANGVDPKWDRDEIARVRATGAQAIVSGQGGDAVFMQISGAGIVADVWRRRGWATLRDPVLGDVARRTHRAAWSILRDAWAEGRGQATPPEDLWSSLISRDVRSATQHLQPKWLIEAQARGVPPGKQLHIHALARFFLNEGPSRRRQEVDIVYPLFAQPVVECCLRIPTPVLAGASYDRAYARAAFADRLPEAIVKRRAKGIVTVYFAKLIANSLGSLRPFLLDGCLAEARILDRAHLEQALTPDHLIWGAKPSDILWAVATEAWVRHWQRRVPDSLAAPRER